MTDNSTPKRVPFAGWGHPKRATKPLELTLLACVLGEYLQSIRSAIRDYSGLIWERSRHAETDKT